MVVREETELDAIEAWDASRFRFELGWRHRLGVPESKARWTSRTGSTTVEVGEGVEDLACGLIACHAIQGEHAIDFALAWSRAELETGIDADVDPALTSLLHPFGRITVPIESMIDLGRLVESITEAIAEGRCRGPFLRDVLHRGGAGERPLVDPRSLPVRVVEADGATTSAPAAWEFRRDRDGVWSASGPAWAMSTFASLLEDRRRILETDPDTPVSSLGRVVGDTERLVMSWEGSGEIPRPKSFLEPIWRRLRAADPDAVLVDSISDGGATDREMADLVDAWSTTLERAGVRPGDMVPVALDRGTPFVAVMFAVLGLGGTFVPLDPLAPDDRIQRMLEVLSASVGVRGRGRTIPGASIDWIVAPADGGAGRRRFDRFDRPNADDVAFVLFTSGSTGNPRGVRISHRNFDQYLEVVAEAIRPDAYEGSAWTSSVAFDSSVAEVIYPVVHGGRIIVLEEVDLASAASLSRAFRRRRITGFGCATALWSTWMKHLSGNEDSIPETLRHVDIGGSVAESGLVRRWLDLASSEQVLMNRYGPTETTVTVTAHRIRSSSGDDGTIPIGRPERGTEIRILDEFGRRVPPGVEGEIWIGGGQVALGYLGSGEDQGGFQSLAGAEGRWFRTGDRGVWNLDGEILFGGRTDDQVKVGGFRVELGEIRRSIMRFDARYEIEVLMTGDGAGASLGVVVEADPSQIDTEGWIADMRAGLASVLPRYAVPRRWRFVKCMGRTASGKVDRRAARALFDDGDAERLVAVDRDSPDWVVEQVERVLGHPVEDRSCSFFELGGDSLAAMRLHAILQEASGRSLPTMLIHAARDIDDLARRCESTSTADDTDLRSRGHRRRRVVDSDADPTIIFMPGIHGEATLRHVWGRLGARATVEAIDLDLDRCRELLGQTPVDAGFDRLVEDLAEIVLSRGVPESTVLAGYSLGGWLAFSVAANLQRRDVRVAAPLLIEPGVHVDGSSLERGRRRFDSLLDTATNLDPWRRVRRRIRTRPRDAGWIDPRDPRGRAPDARDHEFADLLIGSLASHRPVPSPIAVRLVTRRGRHRRFGEWWRLALGGVEHEPVDLVEHEDFFRFGSEPVLEDVLIRHLTAGSATPGRA